MEDYLVSRPSDEADSLEGAGLQSDIVHVARSPLFIRVLATALTLPPGGATFLRSFQDRIRDAGCNHRAPSRLTALSAHRQEKHTSSLGSCGVHNHRAARTTLCYN